MSNELNIIKKLAGLKEGIRHYDDLTDTVADYLISKNPASKDDITKLVIDYFKDNNMLEKLNVTRMRNILDTFNEKCHDQGLTSFWEKDQYDPNRIK